MRTIAELSSDPVVGRFVQDKLSLIAQEFAPTHLILFGSRATGQARTDSDIDLIVVSDRFRDVRYPNRMGDFLIKVQPDVHVDAICYTPEEFAEALQAQSSFVRDAMANGVDIQH